MSFLKKYFDKWKKEADNIYTKSDYDETYRIIKFIFRLAGIRIGCNDTPIARFCYDLYVYIVMLSLMFALFLEILFVIITANTAKSPEDIFTIYGTLPCISYVLLAILKGYKMLLRRPVFENLIEELRSMWPEGTVGEPEHNTLRDALKQAHLVLKAYTCSNTLLSISYFAVCYIDVARRAFGADIPRKLPFHFWLWFDGEQPIAFESLLVLQNWQTNTTLLFMVSGDLIFCIFLSHICTQLDLLSIRINNMFHVPVDRQLIAEYPLASHSKPTDTEGAMSIYEIEEKHHRELISIVKRHEDLIRLAQDVEDLFNFILFVNFLFTTIIICFCGFYCLLVEKYNEVTYKLFLISSLAQTGLICWFGQKLINSSTGIANAIYNSGWYMASKITKSTMIIILHRSQKEVRVTTYGFSNICLASFATIIKSSWSYFTLLLNTYNRSL